MPVRRTAIGIESMDLQLDVVATPDRVWSWKDADEFDRIADRGLLDAETVERVRAEAAAVIGRLEANEAPFDEGWDQWRPDPSWGLPRLPAGWDDPAL
jgi:predicted RNA-binding protein associated with RNAse of E/G family